jgi:hypothetical protein
LSPSPPQPQRRSLDRSTDPWNKSPTPPNKERPPRYSLIEKYFQDHEKFARADINEDTPHNSKKKKKKKNPNNRANIFSRYDGLMKPFSQTYHELLDEIEEVHNEKDSPQVTNIETLKRKATDEENKAPQADIDDTAETVESINYIELPDNLPKSHKKAFAEDRSDAQLWKAAAESELQSHKENGTWTKVPRPRNKQVIHCHWVFTVKQDADGNVERYKARLVANGNQQKNRGFQQTYAPVAKYASIRAFLAAAALFDWEVDQMDVKTAYLNGDAEAEVYMEQPPGFEIDKAGTVLLLNKSLYGLTTSARAWYKKIDSRLVEAGFIRSDADQSVYFKLTEATIIIITLYVDDLLIFTNCKTALNTTKDYLKSQFKMTDLGPAKYILGIKIQRDRKNRILTMDQAQYIQEITERFNLTDCKPTYNPVATGTVLERKTTPHPEMMNVPYASIVGSINYAAIATRPDLAQIVGMLARHNKCPHPVHWEAAKRALRYLYTTRHFKLTFRGDQNRNTTFTVYGDADFAGETETCRSTTGYVFMFANGAIQWKSQLQTEDNIATSTTEAEYRAAYAAGTECEWMRRLLDQTQTTFGVPTLYCDNQGAIKLSDNLDLKGRSKHFRVKYHWVRNGVKLGYFVIEYMPTANMIADALTKPLKGPIFHTLRQAMGVLDLRAGEGIAYAVSLH